jgi:hypothetical protein
VVAFWVPCSVTEIKGNVLPSDIAVPESLICPKDRTVKQHKVSVANILDINILLVKYLTVGAFARNVLRLSSGTCFGNQIYEVKSDFEG